MHLSVTFVKNQVTICVSVYLWTIFCYNGLYVFSSAKYCLNYYGFIIDLDT